MFSRLALVLSLATCVGCALPSRAEDVRPPGVSIAYEQVPGDWLGIHPGWRGPVVFYQDGSFVRPHIGAGKWEIGEEGGSSFVLLRWNSWGSEKLGAWSSEYLSGAQRSGQFRLYRIPSAPPRDLPKEPNPAGIEATKGRLDDSSWELIDRKRFKLNSDGTVTSAFDERKGTWEVLAPNTLKILVPWEPAPAPIVTTNDDAKLLRWSDDEVYVAIREGA